MDKKDIKKIAKLIDEFNEEKRSLKEKKDQEKIKKLEEKQLKKRIDLFNKEIYDPERFINFLPESYEFSDNYSLEPEEIIDVNFSIIEFRSEIRSLILEKFNKFLDI